MLTRENVRLGQSQVLSNMLIGMSQGTLIAEKVLPRLPQTLSKVTIAQAGNERLKRYNLRRAPGTATKRINITLDGKTYSVKQSAVDIPIPREVMAEADEAAKLNVMLHIPVSQIAIATANDVLGLDYELEVADIVTNPANYAAGNTQALAGATKWSATTGTPMTDFEVGRNIVRKKIGKKPNTATFSADGWSAFKFNQQVMSYLPSTQQGPATLDQAKNILEVDYINVGEAIYVDEAGNGQDVWGNCASLSYVPPSLLAAGAANGNGNANTGTLSLVEPAFGFTNVLEGHPVVEVPYFDRETKSWIYGATFERFPNIATNGAAFLFTNVK